MQKKRCVRCFLKFLNWPQHMFRRSCPLTLAHAHYSLTSYVPPMSIIIIIIIMFGINNIFFSFYVINLYVQFVYIQKHMKINAYDSWLDMMQKKSRNYVQIYEWRLDIVSNNFCKTADRSYYMLNINCTQCH